MAITMIIARITIIITIEIASNTGKKSEFQIGFELTILRDLERMLSPLSYKDSAVRKGEMWAFDWNRIARSQIQMMTGTYIHLIAIRLS